MSFIKWFLYFLALGAFIWYVFLREVTAEALNPGPTEIVADMNQNSSENLEPPVYTEKDTTMVVDENWEDNGTTEEQFNNEWEESSDVVFEETEEVDQSKTVEMEPKKEKPIPTTPSSALDLNAKYLVVVGSFGNKGNANRLLSKVIESYPNATVSYINGLSRVVIASYDEENDAEANKLSYINATGGSAFVLAQ